uniref:hypothetical protein n=1 Tax=Lactococcus petauri TaxID=1940789 RepID=UPI001F5984FE
QAKTYNLGGVNYKWTRTWHNWRRISKARSRIAVPVDPSLKDQKVMGTSNPYAFQQQKDYSLDLGLQGSFAQNLRYFGTNKNDLNQKVGQMGATISTRAYLIGDKYSYAISKSGAVMRVAKNDHPKPLITVGNGLAFRDTVNDMRSDLGRILGFGVSIAVIVAVVVLCPEGSAVLSFINELNSAAGMMLAQVITSILGLPGDFKKGLLAAFMACLVTYIYKSYQVGRIYNGL